MIKSFPNERTSRLRRIAVPGFLLWLFFVARLAGQTEASLEPGGAAATVSLHANGVITVDNIRLSGNKRTKAEIILRELDFRIGDTLALEGLAERLRQNEFNILNTSLFTDARIYFKNWEAATNRVSLQIDLKEGWYVFPFPIVELADRNFNVWWEDYDRSLRRLNLGVRFYHTNFTGRKDLLKLVGQVGFTKKYELIYTLPYFNKRRTLGLNLNALYTREKEIGYNTVENKLLFHRNDDHVLLRRFRAGGGLLYRRRLDVYHQWNVTYQHNVVHESVEQELNPYFFLHKLHQQYVAASYQFTLDKRDIRPYPMRGYYVGASLSKLGITKQEDMNALDATLALQQFFTLSKRWSAAFGAKGKLGLIREQQPYYNSRALGYEPDYLRGYEFYVIDGLDYAYQKTSLRFELFNREVNWGKYMLLESFKVMPIKLYLSLHNDLGYVNNPFYKTANPMSNRLLWSQSLGLDMIFYYDKAFSVELSRNHFNEFGLFLHWTFNF
jgi:hypothetical protein